MNAYTYGTQNFKKADIGNNITLFYDENNGNDLPQINSSFSYFQILPVAGEDMWRLEEVKLNAVHCDYVIATENLAGVLTPVNKIYLGEELFAEVFPEYILPTDEFLVFEIDGQYILQLSASILLEEAIITAKPGTPRKPLRKPDKVMRATNRLGETGVLFTMFISSDGAKLERAYQQITELDTRELVLFVETKDKDNIFGTVMRIKSGSGIGESERGIPFSAIAKIPRYFGFDVEEQYFRKIIKRHYQNVIANRENILYIVVKKGKLFANRLIEVPIKLVLDPVLTEAENAVSEIQNTLKLGKERWDSDHPQYNPLMPLFPEGKIDIESTVNALNNNYFNPLEKKIQSIIHVLKKTDFDFGFAIERLQLVQKVVQGMPGSVKILLTGMTEGLSGVHHYYNALLVGLINSLIDLIASVFQIMLLVMRAYQLQLTSVQSMAENPSSNISFLLESFENAVETISNTFTLKNLKAWMDFQQYVLEKVVDYGIHTLQNLEMPNDIKLPFSTVGYYTGYVTGLVAQEVIVFLLTGGAGNVAEAIRLMMKSYGSMVTGAARTSKQLAGYTLKNVEDFIKILAQIRKYSRQIPELLEDLKQLVDELFETAKKNNEELRNKKRNELFSNIKGKPINSKLLKKLQKEFELLGGEMRYNEESWDYVKARSKSLGVEVEAITIGDDLIMLGKDVTTSAVYEELIHTRQFKSGLFNQTMTKYGYEITDNLMEKLAAEELLARADEWKLPKEEIELIKQRLEFFIEELKILGYEN